MVEISVCMIVKNAEKHLERCFNSLQGIVDEIIVVDTGSEDKTVEIAERYGAIVKHFQWNNDFSAARNESLKYATKEWILIIDDDEAFDKLELQRLKSKLDDLDADAIILGKKNFTNERNLQGWIGSQEVEGFDGYFISKRVQLFKNNKGITFSHALHETIMPSMKGAKISEVTDVFLLHYGYKSGKDTYAALAEKELSGDNIKTLYEAGVAFLNTGAYDKSIEAFSKVKGLKPGYKSTLTNLGAAYTKKGKFFEAAEEYLQAIERDEKNLTAYNNLAVLFRKVKNYDKAELLLKKALNLQKDPRLFYLLAMVYADKGDEEKMKQAVRLGLLHFKQDKKLLELYNSF